MKKCTKCQIDKNLDEFGKRKTNKDGLKYTCKKCESDYGKQNYILNKDKINQKTKEYYNKNRDVILPKNREKSNNWRKNNHEKSIIIQRERRKKFLHQIREYDNNWKKNRRKTDINYKIKVNLRERIRKAVINDFKRGKTLKLLGCSIEYYKQYLSSLFTSEMTWENYGAYWEIDHIVSICNFNLVEEGEQFKAFNYLNTRPLEKSQNRQRKKYN